MMGLRPQAAGCDRGLLSRLVLGCAPLGNLFAPVSDEQARATVVAAWEMGIRSFDTAPHYGLGLSERRLGEALREWPRDELVLSTKVGRLLEPLDAATGGDDGFAVPATHRRRWDFSREGVLRSLEASLDRLGLDRVDTVYIHDPDDHYREALEHAYPALHELRDHGVVRSIGAGMNQSRMLAAFAEHTDMDVLLVAGRYTLLDQGALDDLLPVCTRRGIAVVAAAVFNSGLLAHERPSRDAPYDYAEAPAELVERAQRIAGVCERHGTTLPAAALAFPLAHPAVAAICAGARSAGEVRRIAHLMASPPPGELWSDLAGEGLLRPDAPVTTS